jgi:hypothetical protein
MKGEAALFFVKDRTRPTMYAPYKPAKKWR